MVLGRDLWESGRRYFFNCQNRFDEIGILPVLDENYKLVCFAYDDEEADRELRMLKELEQTDGAVDFRDVYPEYDSVSISGCNELAYFFVQYLKKKGIPVQVSGEMWDLLGEWESGGVQGIRQYRVYAEGTGEVPADLQERKLISVSPEFECVDAVYAKNVALGNISHAEGDFATLLLRLKEKSEVIILGTGVEAQNAYDLLLANGIDIFCFVSQEKEEKKRRLLGKQILDRKTAAEYCKEPVFIECEEKHSAWGFGGVDQYAYAGFERNVNFYLLRDYMEIPQNGLRNVLRRKKLVLLGDIHLCSRLNRYLLRHVTEAKVIGYWDVKEEHQAGAFGIPSCGQDQIEEDTICLVNVPRYFVDEKDIEAKNREKGRYLSALKDAGIDNYTEYFSDTIVSVHMEAAEPEKYAKSRLKPAAVMIGSIGNSSGNMFFRSVLDHHPNVLLMEYSYVNHNLFDICIRLAEEPSSNILTEFWRLCDIETADLRMNFRKEMEMEFPNRELFNQKMRMLMADDISFTSQEIFVMIHFAYSAMWGHEVTDIRNAFIYWEPHHINRIMTEQFALWLGSRDIKGYMFNMVRNFAIVAGSICYGGMSVRGAFPVWHLLSYIYYMLTEKKIEYECWERIVVKFEDIKCDPKRELKAVCEKTGLSWSDTFLETSCHGKVEDWEGVPGYFLTPVFKNYEECLSEFDRLRIMLAAADWQKRYGYPYVSCRDFTRRELRDMFLKEFRFEGMTAQGSQNGLRKAKITAQRYVGQILWLEWVSENSSDDVLEQKERTRL